MTTMRVVLGALLCGAVAMGTVGCGGDGGSENVWEHPELQFVADELSMPFTTALSTQMGFDLDDDGNVDNRLGEILVATASIFPPEAQDEINNVVDAGGAIHLFSLYAAGPTETSDAALWAFLGEPEDLVGGMTPGLDYSIDESAGTAMILEGTVAAGLGTFASDQARLMVTFPLTSTAKATFSVHLPRVEFELSADGSTLTGTIGGAVPEDEISSSLTPALDDQLARNCDARQPGAPASPCGCNGPGAQAIQANFDTDGDCTITFAEIETNPLLSAVIDGDITLADGTPALSLGIGFHAIMATFTHLPPPH